MTDIIYNKNINAIRTRFPDIAEYIEHSSDETGMIEEDSIITAGVCNVDGKSVLAAEKDGITYRLDSLYDSTPLLDLWYKSLGDEWDLNSKLFMYGLGSGIYVRKFLCSARSDCKIIVYEPSLRIVTEALKHFDLSDIFSDSRFELIFGPCYADNELRSALDDHMSYSDTNSSRSSIYLNYATLFPGDCVRFHDILIGVREAVAVSQTVHDKFGGYYNRNTFNNLGFLRESRDLEKLAESMPDIIPAVIVAAGPSLDGNIRELANAKGKCVIISTDTALKPLSLAGIVPDIAIIMDGKKDERYLSEEDSRQVPLVCTPRSGTEFLHLHTGPKFFTDDYCDHINEFMKSCGLRLIDLDSGGSVANTCFSLALMFKCKTIIMLGQDLAYTGDKTHSSVTVRGSVKTELEDLEHVVMDVDINGNPIRSSAEFKLYRKWFERKISENPNLNVIDATEGGVRIEGTHLMTAKEAIDKYCTCEFDLSSLVASAPPLFDDETKERYDEFIRAIPEQLNDIRRQIKMAAADYSSMRKLVLSGNYHNSQMKKLYDNCQRLTGKIEANPVTEYVHYQMQGKSTELQNVVNKLEKDEQQELLTVCDMGENYLKDMDAAINELEPYIDIIKKEFK